MTIESGIVGFFSKFIYLKLMKFFVSFSDNDYSSEVCNIIFPLHNLRFFETTIKSDDYQRRFDEEGKWV